MKCGVLGVRNPNFRKWLILKASWFKPTSGLQCRGPLHCCRWFRCKHCLMWLHMLPMWLKVQYDVSPAVAYLFFFLCTSSVFLFTCWYAEELLNQASLAIVSPHEWTSWRLFLLLETSWTSSFLWAPLSCFPLICSEAMELHMVASIPDVMLIL